MARAVYSCTGCKPVDTSIIEAYLLLINTVDIKQGPPGPTPHITVGDVTTGEPGTSASATMTGTPEEPVLNMTIPRGNVGATPDFSIGTVTTGEPGTPAEASITGTDASPVLNLTIPKGAKGDQGNTGSSVDYPFELVNNATTNDATKAATAAVAKGLKDDITQLEAEVTELNYVIAYPTLTLSGGYIKKADGSFVSSTASGYKATEDYLDIRYATRLEVNFPGAGTSYPMVCFYNANKAKLSTIEFSDGQVVTMHKISVPTGAFFARFGGRTSDANWASASVGVVTPAQNVADGVSALDTKVTQTDGKIGTLTSLETTNKSNLVAAINEIYTGFPKDLSAKLSANFAAGYILESDGEYYSNSSDTYKATEDYYFVGHSCRLAVYLSGAGSDYSLVCFYDSQKNKLSSVSTSDNQSLILRYIDVPTGAVYARFGGRLSAANWANTYVGVMFKPEWLAALAENEGQGHAYPALKKSIVCSGSSITWGDGRLDTSMVLYLDKFIREKLSRTILPQDMTFSSAFSDVSNNMLYNSYGRKIDTIGGLIEFDLYGDEIAICQAKRRSTDYGIMKVYADGVLIGTFDNKNDIGSDTESFSGDSLAEIELKHPCTFNHDIVVNGSTPLSVIVYNTGSYGGTPPADPTSYDAFVFRALDSNGHPVHRIQFSSALGTITSVSVSYDYGNICSYEKSTVGQTDDEYTNESRYGNGNTSFDPENPSGGLSSGMEFRAVNRDAFFIHKFTSTALRHIKIELDGGVNPYFIINFATNRYHDLMNAGIGGWKLRFLLDNNKVNDYTQYFKCFMPEVVFEEAGTNDDWDYGTRRIRRNIGKITLAELQVLPWLEVYSVTYDSGLDKYDVDMCTGLIDSITETSLVSQHIVGTSTAVGDIIRIGNYHGDIKQVACRKITEVNTETGEVKWLQPLTPDELINIDTVQDLVGAEINIRDLSGYKAYYKELIEKVHAITPEAKVVVVQNGLPMLWARQLWGYDVIHREVVAESENTTFCNATQMLRDGEFENITGTRKETITPDGSDEYDLSFAGTYKSWYGFKVLVNGVDVYGKDCYIESEYAYLAKSALSGSSLNKSAPYTRSMASLSTGNRPLKLVFTRNAPAVGDDVEVWFADQIWSNDFCHPTDFGAFLYGQAYAKFI